MVYRNLLLNDGRNSNFGMHTWNRSMFRRLLAISSRVRPGNRSYASKKVQKMTHEACYLQVLGSGTSEGEQSVLVFTDTNRYLFNCGENNWRFCNEHKVKVRRVQNVFLTRCSWKNVGGLPVLSLVQKESETADPLQLHGPPELRGFQTASSVFLRKNSFTLKSTTYQDKSITIEPVLLHPSSESGLLPPSKRHKDADADTNSIVAYVCKLPSYAGKFNVKKALELGLPQGPKCARLVRGESVTTRDGKVIHPSDVVGPELRGPEFIIIECPHDRFIPSIAHCARLNSASVQPELIVHICPRQVLDSPSYQQWLQSFGPATKHLLLHSDFCPPEVALRRITKLQLPLHLLDSCFFNLRCHPNKTSENSLLPDIPNTIVGRSLLKYHFRPPRLSGMIEGSLKSFTDEIKETLTELASNDALCHNLKIGQDSTNSSSDQTLISMPTMTTPTVPCEPAVTFLGTAAAAPSKYRNVSGILLHTASDHHMLLDCGEGTLSQLYAYLGKEQAESVLCNLSSVFISHMHPDHFLGLISIIQSRSALLSRETSRSKSRPNLVVIGPTYIDWWIREYNLFCEKIDIDFYSSFNFEKGLENSPPLPLLDFGICKLQTVSVNHSSQSFGIVIGHKDGWSVVYSGDCRPSSQLAEAGQGASLLIHEATFEDDLLALAKERRHCTTKEAIEVAQMMNAEFTILTHFSQRNPKVPAALCNHFSKNVAVAFDGMSVSLRDLPQLSALLPAMQEIFDTLPDEQETDQDLYFFSSVMLS